ncbi:MAG: O-methyltransferase [Vulcanibacillus sp.]
MAFLDEKVERYLNQLMPIKFPLLADLYQEGIEEDIPIIQVPSLKLIEIFLNIIKPEIVIEVGTAIGFSAIWLATACPNAVIHTIERKPEMISKAKNNIEMANLSSRIILHEGDAIYILPTLPKSELIFIDAAKGKYKEFFELAFPLLNVGGVFIFDNILFRGFIADEEIVYTKPMLRKIREFNDVLKNNEKILTSFIPIGDGLAVSYKLED